MQDNVTQALPVIQADREAAADFHKSNSRKMFAENYAEAIRQGLRDSDSMVQAFAAHRLASTTAQTEAVQKLVEALEAIVGETLGGDLSRDDESQVTPRGSYSTWISWNDRWAARDALAAHRESQP